MQTFIPDYVKALVREVRWAARNLAVPLQVGTLFFGGGTPSLLSPQQFDWILAVIRDAFDLENSCEITLEANPGTVDQGRLRALKEMGFNRLSFGMQSAHQGDLRVLNRQHDHVQVINAVAWSKQAGFEHINLDLIFGVPGQTLDRWRHTLDLALMENVDHLSLYSLTVEEGTPLHRWVSSGVLPAPDDDLAGEMYETAMRVLNKAGFDQYEISNWARKDDPDSRCRHNLQYWRFQPYLGFGAGAHGFFNNTRTENVSGIEEYITLMEGENGAVFPAGPACMHAKPLGEWEAMQEFMMVGFRLTEEGVCLSKYEEKFSFSAETLFDKQITTLLKSGLIERHPVASDCLRLTKKGILLGNRVFASFVGNREPECLRRSD